MRMLRLFFLFAMVPVLLLLTTTPARAVVRDGLVDGAFSIAPIDVGASGIVRCFALLPDGKILVAGGFSTISGGNSIGIARLNPDGTFDPSFTGRANEAILAIFPLSDGKILISGDFTQYDSVSRNRIAKINADGSVDQSFNPNFGTDYVQIIAVQPDGKIIVQGSFTSIGGVPRNRLARLNPDGSPDLDFQVGTGIPNGSVEKAVVQPDGKILLAGHFSSYNGVSRPGVLRLNPSGSLDENFVPGITGDSNEFFDISVAGDGKIYLVGDVFGGRIFRLNTDGSTDAAFAVGSTVSNGGRIYSVLAQPDGKAIAGGDFDSFFTASGLVSKAGLVRFNVDGSIDNSFTATTAGTGTSGSSGRVRALAMQGEAQVLIGGDFGRLNGNDRGGIGRISLDGASDPAFNAFLGSYTNIHKFHLLSNGKLLVVGNFDAIGTSFKKYAARLDPDGSVDASFTLDPRVDGSLFSIAVQPNGKILLGGYSGDSSFGETLSRGIWRINADGTLDTTFDASIAALETVRSIAVQTDGRILIGGTFSRVNGTIKTRIARLNPNGSLDNSFEPELGSPGVFVNAIKLQADGKILVGGSFGSVDGNQIANVVRLNADGSVDTGFNIGIGANNTVNDFLVLPDNRIYIAGSFSQFNGSSRTSLVRLLPDGTFDPSFKRPRISNGVSSIALQSDNKVVIGGAVSSFTVDTESRQSILRLLEDGSIDFSFKVGAVTNSPGSVFVDQVGVQADGKTVACGQFSKVGGINRPGFVRLTKNLFPTPANFDFDGDGRSDLSVYRPSSGTWFRINSYLSRVRTVQYGTAEDHPVAADFDGDYISDIAVFRPSNGGWYLIRSSDNTFDLFNWGSDGDLPVPSDRDGDGKADLVVFRPSNNTWYTRYSAGSSFSSTQFGETGDKPVVGDFDGDGAGDIAVFRPSNNNWYIIKSGIGFFIYTWGEAGDIPVPADYDGDGAADVAIFRPSTGEWYRINSGGGIEINSFGANGDQPVPADYDGDGKADIAVFRPSTGQWWLKKSAEGFFTQTYGINGDVPVPNSFIY